MPRVKVQARVTKRQGREYITYQVTLPKPIVEALNIREGDELECIIKEVPINGETKIAIVFYKS